MTYLEISALSGTMSGDEATLFSLLSERAARLSEPPNTLENEEDGHNNEEISCEKMLERFGENYVKELTGFTDAQVMEILEVCKETLKPVGPGRRYRDMKSRLIVYLVWLTSGWTVKKIGCLFDVAKATIQRTLTYVMSGLTESLKVAYLPKSIRDINISSQFKNFPQAIGAVDATLIPVQKPSDRENEGLYYSGKHHAHGAKVQVVVSSDGFAIHVSKVIPGRRHDAFLFRISGVDSFMKDSIKIGGTTRAFRPALLGDSGYIGLEDIYPELIVTRKRSKNKELSTEDEQWNSRLHSDRVLVENYFGRLKSVFGILARPYRGALNALEDVVITCICLLNMMLKANPLRKQDAEESELSSEATLSMMLDSPGDPPSSKRGPKK